MNAKELADKLNGIEYPMRDIKERIEGAKESGLVVIVGYSDDGASVLGAINEEVSAWEGVDILFTESDIYREQCEDEYCPHEEKIKSRCKIVKAIWLKDEYSWVYETSIPHVTFDVNEGKDKYCRGIVFNINDLKG